MSGIVNPGHTDIIEGYIKGDWQAVIEAQCSLNDAYFLWPKPKKTDLDFIANSLRKLNITKIVSIGCGSGLLEWLLMIVTGLKVSGIEIDKNYWKSKYAKRSFIDMVFPQDSDFSEIITGKNSAIMFCYFNNGSAFLDYLYRYHGKCVIIIGPNNSGRHTDPSPLSDDIPSEWILWKLREICATGDYIAIYTRNKKYIV